MGSYPPGILEDEMAAAREAPAPTGERHTCSRCDAVFPEPPPFLDSAGDQVCAPCHDALCNPAPTGEVTAEEMAREVWQEVHLAHLAGDGRYAIERIAAALTQYAQQQIDRAVYAERKWTEALAQRDGAYQEGGLVEAELAALMEAIQELRDGCEPSEHVNGHQLEQMLAGLLDTPKTETEPTP